MNDPQNGMDVTDFTKDKTKNVPCLQLQMTSDLSQGTCLDFSKYKITKATTYIMFLHFSKHLCQPQKTKQPLRLMAHSHCRIRTWIPNPMYYTEVFTLVRIQIQIPTRMVSGTVTVPILRMDLCPNFTIFQSKDRSLNPNQWEISALYSNLSPSLSPNPSPAI